MNAERPNPDRVTTDWQLHIRSFDEPIDPDDPDANFLYDVAAHAPLDVEPNITNVASNVGVEPGALVQYILAKWGTGGSEGITAIGPNTLDRLLQIIDDTDPDDPGQAQAAFVKLAEIIRWLDLGRQPGTYDKTAG